MEVSGWFHDLTCLFLMRLEGTLSGLQTRYRLLGEEKHILALSGIEPQFIKRPALTLGLVPIEISRFPLWGIWTLSVAMSKLAVAETSGLDSMLVHRL